MSNDKSEMYAMFREIRMILLDHGGVDNWTWYSESIQQWEEDNDREVEDDEDRLYALEQGGVDNWEWYGESLEGYYDWTEHVEEHWEKGDFMDFWEYKEKVYDKENNDDED